MQAQPAYYPEAQEPGVILLDEEWQRQTEISERRKAQNRLAQRNFRKRRSQQQQQQQQPSKQQQEKKHSKQDSASNSSYPSPRPSPQSSYRSVKSPDQDTTSRGSISRERSSSASQLGTSAGSSRGMSITPHSMLPNDFMSMEEGTMNPPTYHSGHPGHPANMGAHMSYQGHLENGAGPGVVGNPISYDSGIYSSQYSMPTYGNGIRPAIIPRTEGPAQAGGSPHSASQFRSSRRTPVSGMSIDISDAGSPGCSNQTLISPEAPQSAASSSYSQGLSPGLNSCPGGQYSLHLSAERGHEGTVRLLLDCGADPDGRDDIGSTPLHLAAKNGHEQIVLELLGRGADVNAKNANGWTAVHIASKYGYENILRLLIHRGADLNVKAMDVKSRHGSVS